MAAKKSAKKPGAKVDSGTAAFLRAMELDRAKAAQLMGSVGAGIGAPAGARQATLRAPIETATTLAAQLASTGARNMQERRSSLSAYGANRGAQSAYTRSAVALQRQLEEMAIRAASQPNPLELRRLQNDEEQARWQRSMGERWFESQSGQEEKLKSQLTGEQLAPYRQRYINFLRDRKAGKTPTEGRADIMAEIRALGPEYEQSFLGWLPTALGQYPGRTASGGAVTPPGSITSGWGQTTRQYAPNALRAVPGFNMGIYTQDLMRWLRRKPRKAKVPKAEAPAGSGDYSFLRYLDSIGQNQ